MRMSYRETGQNGFRSSVVGTLILQKKPNSNHFQQELVLRWPFNQIQNFVLHNSKTKLENSLTNLVESHAQEPLDHIVSEAFKVFQTPPEMTVSEFADTERHLSSEASAMVGLWDTSVTEYLRGVMDAVSDPSIEEVVLMSASQCGKTEVILNTLAYHVAYDPCPCIIVMPNDGMCQSLSRDRIAPMVRDSPILKERLQKPKVGTAETQSPTKHSKWKFDSGISAISCKPFRKKCPSCRL